MGIEQNNPPREIARHCAFCHMAITGGVQLESRAEGVEALEAQERLISLQDKTHTLRTMSSYAISAVFAALAFSLIMWAPAIREAAANIAAGSFLILAAGIAGFTRFRASAPTISIEGGRSEGRPPTAIERR